MTFLRLMIIKTHGDGHDTTLFTTQPMTIFAEHALSREIEAFRDINSPELKEVKYCPNLPLLHPACREPLDAGVELLLLEGESCKLKDELQHGSEDLALAHESWNVFTVQTSQITIPVS